MKVSQFNVEKPGGLTSVAEMARSAYMKTADLGSNPILAIREYNLPVGLEVCQHD
jgi:hypothetical protein